MPHRLTSLTPEVHDSIVKLIESGNYIEVACQACGISTPTYYNWLKRGEDGEEPFLSFFNAVRDAEAIAETRMVETINEAATKNKDWKAAMEYLGRKKPDRWARKDRVEHSGNEENPIKVKLVWSNQVASSDL
jgi:hypothetical protein